MNNIVSKIPTPYNESIKNYSPGSQERASLQKELKRMSEETFKVPLVIHGEKIYTKETSSIPCPHDKKRIVATASVASKEQVSSAISNCVATQKEWAKLPWEERASVFLKAADLLSGKYRDRMNASTMLGQSKSCFQSEVDAACEMADFFRFNVKFAEMIYGQQPMVNAQGQWNHSMARGLEGFVFAIAPFNFTSISINLAAAPALMGCSVLWKPSPTGAFSSYVGLEILEEAGLPPGVINFITGEAETIGTLALASKDFAGIHFTGSTKTFEFLWQEAGKNLHNYKNYPRIVGETGGKDFIFAHPSCDPVHLLYSMIRGAFEYQGQKCSAASRAYIPKSVWNKIEAQLVEETEKILMGDVQNFENFVNAVIDERSFTKIAGYIDRAKNSKDAKILCGGTYDQTVGYFVRPTIILANTPHYESMCEEIFGPVLTIYVYDDKDMEETLRICANTSPYALTGAIFAKDRNAIHHLSNILEYSAGNFYINDKPTGAVVGQQPFGGSRKSGTNDKAGSIYNLQRWVSMRTIKENFIHINSYKYPFMGKD